MKAFLLKGSAVNLSWSLFDMKYRQTKALLGKPSNWMVWGVNERFKWVIASFPFEAFIYVVSSPEAPSGLALYGTALEPVELPEKYWPRGEKWKTFFMKIEAAAPGVLEEPEFPARWRLVPRDEMKKKGVFIMPGPQKLDAVTAAALKELFYVQSPP